MRLRRRLIQQHTLNRWASFTQDEIAALVDAFTMDDGLRYGVEQSDPCYAMLIELANEVVARGMRYHVAHSATSVEVWPLKDEET